MLSYDHNGRFTAPSAMSNSQATNGVMPTRLPHRHIWIITGPAGCGKSTVAKFLANQLSLPYVEGDEFHPQANIEKMRSGIPLTDADRWDWLISLRQKSLEELKAGASGVVLTCSALKRKYRDVIRIAAYNDSDVLVHFVYLAADEGTLLARVKARQNHYMKDAMVQSQLRSLEPPTPEERDVLSVDVSGSMSEVEELVLATVMNTLAQDGGFN